MQPESATDAGDKADHSEDASRQLISAHSYRTTLAHRIFLLVSTAFCLFELIFLWLYGDRGWFSVDLLICTLPLFLITGAAAHFLLKWLEGPSGVLCTKFISKGLPSAPYERWVEVDEPNFPPSIRFGNKRALWSAIDSADLTFFGNLRLMSRATSGPPVIKKILGRERDVNSPLLLLKIPFGIASRRDQSSLVETIKARNPECLLSARLIKQCSTIEPAGTSMVLNVVSLFFILFFMDVVFSSLSYLEMLKYYTIAIESTEISRASSNFAKAEQLRLHPLPISFVTRKMIQTPSAKSGVMQVRADALWSMNKRDEAIASMREALEEHGKNFRAELKLSRMLVDTGQLKEALAVLDKASEKSKKALVPKMYVLSLLQSSQSSSENKAAIEYYEQAMKSLDEELFKDDNGWPPGVSPYLPDVWHREDVDFVVTKMLHKSAAEKSNEHH